MLRQVSDHVIEKIASTSSVLDECADEAKGGHDERA
jgi:hypothetical protein